MAVRRVRIRTDESGQVSAGIMPEGLSVAVLPFNNMSSDPEQEYFAHGMVEDIITVWPVIQASWSSLEILLLHTWESRRTSAPSVAILGADMCLKAQSDALVKKSVLSLS